MKSLSFCVVFYACVFVGGELQVNRSCGRNRTCISIRSCPHYMNLLKNKPIPSSLFGEITRNLCGTDDTHKTFKICCPHPKKDDSNNHDHYRLLPMEICGPVSLGSRITEGGNAAPREFPWMALIAYQTGDSLDDEDFKCGGSLINERYVLTAAHCLDDKSVLGVRLGEYDISIEKECYHKGRGCEPPVQDIEIDKIIIHDDYNPSTYINDIALIRLSKVANMSKDNVKPICLPTESLGRSLVGRSLTVTGWGTTETGHKSMVLNKVTIPVVPLNECRRLFGKLAVITRTQICAGGYKGRDSCSGDSGGPLQYITSVGQKQKFVQYGIVSYGPKQCGIAGWPAIYTNVREFMTWIVDNMEA